MNLPGPHAGGIAGAIIYFLPAIVVQDKLKRNDPHQT
jgi:hypothetical protein